MKEQLREKRLIKQLANGRVGTLFIDNCSGYNINESVLKAAGDVCAVLT